MMQNENYLFHRHVLRFITAGSVDDGKSTLIGRLLFDSKAILSDQLVALSKVKNKRTQNGEIDLALLSDGLEAEREQGITIDVAYRYFATAERKFIIADTPGHEQYTRNMITGASTADAAIILIDVSRVFDKQGNVNLLLQTKRHSAIVKLLNIPYVIVAVNKMDLFAYDQDVFDQVCQAYSQLAEQLGLKEVRFVPVSALKGDNIVQKSAQMPWYSGSSLLSILESLPLQTGVEQDLRFVVQWVSRQDGSALEGFRGYMGQISSGQIKVGQKITILPSNQRATVQEIIVPIPKGTMSVKEAFSGQAVTIHLQENLDISRGDVFVNDPSSLYISKKIQADLCWFSEEPLNQNRKYVLKHRIFSTFSKITDIHSVLDVHTLSHHLSKKEIVMNDIARVSLTIQQPIVGDTYNAHPQMGSFILIDEASHDTVAAGLIRSFDA